MRKLRLSIATLTAKTRQTVYHTQEIDFKTNPVLDIGKTQTCASFSRSVNALQEPMTASLGQNKVVRIVKKR